MLAEGTGDNAENRALLVLLLAVLFAFCPIFFAGLVWDDYAIINPDGAIAKVDSLWRVFGGRMIFFEGNGYPYYRPLTDFSFAAQYQIFGADPITYHVFNLALHMLNVALAWKILKRFAGGISPFARACGLAVFALHPLSVESVAWIACRGQLLSQCFAEVALLAAMQFVRGARGAGCAVLALLAFLAAMLSKESAVVLVPAGALFFAIAKGGERKRLAAILGAGVILLVVYTLLNPAARAAQHDLLAAGSIYGMVAGFGFYIGKFFFPHPLLPCYPLGAQDHAIFLALGIVGLLVTLAGAACVIRGNARRGALAAGLVFAACSALLPFAGGQFLLADRYLYPTLFGWSIAAVAMICLLAPRIKIRSELSMIIGSAFVALLTVLAVLQCCLWRTELILWRYSAYDQNVTAYYNLGQALSRAGEQPSAIGAYRLAWKVSAGPMARERAGSLAGVALMRDDLGREKWQEITVIAPQVIERGFVPPERVLPLLYLAQLSLKQAKSAEQTEAQLEAVASRLQSDELLFIAQIQVRVTKDAGRARTWYERARSAGAEQNGEVEGFINAAPAP
ncbi:hypothetical protein BH09SUM1_BH09SUM1_01680 [soil metagenome]